MQTQPSELPPHAVLFDLFWGHFRARVVEVFAALGVADRIAAGRSTGVNERFLRACSTLGLVQRIDGGGYALTPVGELLRTDVPGSMRSAALAWISPNSGHYKAWENLPYSARTEGNAFVETFGEEIWEYFTKTNPEEGEHFNKTMQGVSAGVIGAILELYALPESGLVIDIAGGAGTMLCAFLKKQPGLRGIVTDLEFTRPAAEATIAGEGLGDRCSFEAVDFFQSVPAGGDLYTMKWILHDWSDEQAARILQSIHRAMPAHAKLALFEAVVPEDDAMARDARMMDINMMVLCGGKERSEAEWRELLDANGFQLDRIVATPTPNFVLEASKK